MKLLVTIVVLLVIGVVGLVIVRTLLFKPQEMEPVSPTPVATEDEKIVADMVKMIQCKTISHIEDDQVDWKEYERFEKVLEQCYPMIHKVCHKEKIGRTGILFYLKGKSSTEPSVCMAHYDVVPVEEDGWSKDAFAGIIEDGVLWGRGTLDTKGTVCGILEATEALLNEGFVPANDLYLSFSGEEEVNGESCNSIVAYLKQKGVKPVIVLDEGGADRKSVV